MRGRAGERASFAKLDIVLAQVSYARLRLARIVSPEIAGRAEVSVAADLCKPLIATIAALDRLRAKLRTIGLGSGGEVVEPYRHPPSLS